MRSTTLNNGVEMPMLGFGVFQIPAEQTEAAVLDALQAGYRLIDTAAAYDNEEGVGQAIRASGIPREDIFITTKLWIRDAGEERALAAFDESARKLGVDYIDLYLIHQPVGDVYGSWRAMQRLNREGRARAIGISNFQPDRVMDLMLHHEIVPAVNQIELHPFLQQVETQAFLAEHGILTQSWASFAEGKNDVFNNSMLAGIAHGHGKSVAQVILRWLNQRGVAVIPKSVTPARVRENADIFDFELTPDEMAAISALDTRTTLFIDHRDPAMVKWLYELKS